MCVCLIGRSSKMYRMIHQRSTYSYPKISYVGTQYKSVETPHRYHLFNKAIKPKKRRNLILRVAFIKARHPHIPHYAHIIIQLQRGKQLEQNNESTLQSHSNRRLHRHFYNECFRILPSSHTYPASNYPCCNIDQ